MRNICQEIRELKQLVKSQISTQNTDVKLQDVAISEPPHKVNKQTQQKESETHLHDKKRADTDRRQQKLIENEKDFQNATYASVTKRNMTDKSEEGRTNASDKMKNQELEFTFVNRKQKKKITAKHRS